MYSFLVSTGVKLYSNFYILPIMSIQLGYTLLKINKLLILFASLDFLRINGQS